MKIIEIKETHNGYIVLLDRSPYVFKSTEILVMLEFVGKFVNERKVEVKER